MRSYSLEYALFAGFFGLLTLACVLLGLGVDLFDGLSIGVAAFPAAGVFGYLTGSAVQCFAADIHQQNQSY